jgi:hypothetical protein
MANLFLLSSTNTQTHTQDIFLSLYIIFFRTLILAALMLMCTIILLFSYILSLSHSFSFTRIFFSLSLLIFCKFIFIFRPICKKFLHFFTPRKIFSILEIFHNFILKKPYGNSKRTYVFRGAAFITK